MKNTKITPLIGTFITVIIIFTSCKSETKPPQRTTKPLERISDPWKAEEQATILKWQKERQTKDSLAKYFPIGKMKFTRDSKEVKWVFQEIDPDGFISLANVYFYMRGVESQNGISLYSIQDKFGKYLSFKRNDMDSWDISMKKIVNKLSSTLNSKEKVAVAKSLRENARLIDTLAHLDSSSLTNLIHYLNQISSAQEKNRSWMFTHQGSTILTNEYNLLKKVWAMPKLILVHPENESGEYLVLGKNVTSIQYDVPVWSTRYLNRYQFAVGIFHRRCKDMKAKTYAQRQEVAHRIASTMRNGSEYLLQ